MEPFIQAWTKCGLLKAYAVLATDKLLKLAEGGNPDFAAKILVEAGYDLDHIREGLERLKGTPSSSASGTVAFILNMD